MFTRKSLGRPIFMGWTTSLALHGLFVALVLAEALALISLALKPGGTKQPSQVITMAAAWSKLPPEDQSVPVKIAGDQPPPKIPRLPEEPADEAEVKPENGPSFTGNKIVELVQEAADAAQNRSAEENQQTLQDLTGTLNRVSDDQSLEGLMGSLNKVFQTTPRASQPAAEPVAGEFDFNTAQIHDVRREELDNGCYRYTAILLDAEGRTLDSEMDEAEGARVYEIFALIKQNPLLEKLYRGMLLGLFDKMMKPESNQPTATPAAINNPPTQSVPAPEVKPNSPQPGVPFDPFAE